jgi:hypothetical protein
MMRMALGITAWIGLVAKIAFAQQSLAVVPDESFYNGKVFASKNGGF